MKKTIITAHPAVYTRRTDEEGNEYWDLTQDSWVEQREMTPEEQQQHEEFSAVITREAAESQSRMRRDQLLRESDLLVMPDRWQQLTALQQQQLADYRQRLRDLTDSPEWPNITQWPELPQ